MRLPFRSIPLLALSAVIAACSDQGPVVPRAASDFAAPRLNSYPPSLNVRLSEFHYDNAGTDAGEAVEVSGPAGTDLTGWSVVLYNGANGTVYDTKALSGLIPATAGCGTRGVVQVVYPANGIQNGSPDGIALVNNGALVEFLSYEGTFTGVGGAANAVLSTDIGVEETGTTAVGFSLQRTSSNTWDAPKQATFGICNDESGGVVAPVVDRVAVSPVNPSIVAGATQQFTATAFDVNNQPIVGVVFVWSTGTPTTANINVGGLATGAAEGTSVITATAPNGVSATSLLTVTAAPVVVLPPIRFTEIHYDNVGTDVNERIEVEGPAGTDLTGWRVVLYNGSNGAAYDSVSLAGTMPATCSARGVVVAGFPQDGIQNGANDGFALINGSNQVVEFLSYEGTLTATDGAASGMLSVDIGVSETGVPLARSLQRNVSGAWQAGGVANFGACNSGGGTALSNASITFTGRSAFNDPALPVGFQDQLFGAVADENGQSVVTTVQWSSLTPAIASIDADGVMTSLAAGSARFRATDASGVIAADYVLSMTVATPSAVQYMGNAAFGEPADADASDDFILRRNEFTTSFSHVRNTPNWVSYNLDATHIVSGQDRCDCFTYDPSLPQNFTRYTTADYTGAGAFAGFGIDRGHLARSFDRTAGSLDNARSFYFSNIIPQAAAMNQGPWAVLENFLGNEATANNKEVYIVTGVSGNIGTVKGEGVITIPEYVWKVAVILPRDQGLANIVNGTEPTVIAVIMPNSPNVNADWNTYRTTVDAIEQLSGYDLLALLPDVIESQLEQGNNFPVARAGGPYVGAEGSAVAFSGAASTDPDAGAVLSYAWNFGDGTSATGAAPNKTYANNGTYAVTLTVTDQYGASTRNTTTATISNVAPTVALTPPATWTRGVSGNLRVAFTDPNTKDSPFIVRINWGDGTPNTQFGATVIPVTPFSRPHTYTTAGNYAITVTVTDRDGGIGTQTLQISVQP